MVFFKIHVLFDVVSKSLIFFCRSALYMLFFGDLLIVNTLYFFHFNRCISDTDTNSESIINFFYKIAEKLTMNRRNFFNLLLFRC